MKAADSSTRIFGEERGICALRVLTLTIIISHLAIICVAIVATQRNHPYHVSLLKSNIEKGAQPGITSLFICGSAVTPFPQVSPPPQSYTATLPLVVINRRCMPHLHYLRHHANSIAKG